MENKVSPLRAPKTAPGGDVKEWTAKDLAAAGDLARSIKNGEKLTITPTDKGLVVEKQGPDRYQAVKHDTGDMIGTAASALTTGMNASFGVDPTVSSLASLQAAYSTVSSFSLIPSGVTSFFTDNFFPAFRLLAPILDSIKLVNTWKLSKALSKNTAGSAKPKGWRGLFKSGRLGNVVVDGAHVALDVAVAAAIVAAIIHFPPLAFIPKLVALGVGFGGDLAAAAFHGVGASESLSDPANGATFKERLAKFLHTQSWTALRKRVFQGEEPLNEPAAKK